MRNAITLFPLLFMNSAADPDLVDFDINDVRPFTIIGGEVILKEDERDVSLANRLNVSLPRDGEDSRGIPLNASTYDRIFGEFKNRYGRIRRA